AFKDKTFVIVGGGPAASAAVEELRAQGFEGRLVLISRENVPPYDRVMLSKNLKCEPNNSGAAAGRDSRGC
ncbi:pyridine nucleotide-disulphide oxidoreductase domain-containing protein, putative, partial [Eimeria tenella]